MSAAQRLGSPGEQRALASRLPEARLIRHAGRYAMYGELAHGGMATVHLGRFTGAAGFARTVAIKRLHTHYAKDPEFVEMFLEEARLAARIQHPNVVSTLDVVGSGSELLLVMEYVQGETLGRLLRQRSEPVSPAIAAAIMAGVLRGLHSAHEARDQRDQPLDLVHRDVSPQNILVGVDGVPRVLDFGVAKAAGSVHTTLDGVVKGKIGYMSPEQIYGEHLDRRADVYAAGVVLWELLVGERLFVGESNQSALAKALTTAVEPPGVRNPKLPACVDDVVMRALEREAGDRYTTALEMATVLEGSIPLATPSEVAEWVEELAGSTLAERARIIAAIEADPDAVRDADHANDGDRDSGMRARAGSDVVTTRVVRKSTKRRVQLALLGGMMLAALTAFAIPGLRERSPTPPLGRTNDVAADSLTAAAAAHSIAPSGESAVRAPDVERGSAAVMNATFAAPAAPSTAAPAPSAKRSSAGVRAAAQRGARGRAPRARQTSDCDPPFMVDANGHKRYKKHCFQ